MADADADADRQATTMDHALARYQAGEASDTEMASLMEELINTGSIRAVQGIDAAGDDAPRVWAGIIPVGRGLDIWVDGKRRGSASNVALARYRVVAAARPAKVTWVDPFTAHWERIAVTHSPAARRDG